MVKNTSLQIHEAALIAGMINDNRKAQYDLYSYCADYFFSNYRSVFMAEEDVALEILQNSFIKLWENISSRKLYVIEGTVFGKDAKPLTCSIRTYFMAIAKIKYLEFVRMGIKELVRDMRLFEDNDSNLKGIQQYIDIMYDSDDNVMLEIIADVISHMSERCNQILTKFYYEEKDLDCILSEIPSIKSKDALKTKKYKCLEGLKQSANEIYNKYLDS